MSERPDCAGCSNGQRKGQRSVPKSGDGPGGGCALPNLGEVTAQLARSLQEEHGDVESTLQAVTGAAVREVPGTDECGISLVVQGRQVGSRAPTGDLPRQTDQLQERVGEGPCLDAVWEHKTVQIEDIGFDDRWFGFAAEASGTDMRSMLSFQLFATGDNLGALNLYARAPRAYDEESESICWCSPAMPG